MKHTIYLVLLALVITCKNNSEDKNTKIDQLETSIDSIKNSNSILSKELIEVKAEKENLISQNNLLKTTQLKELKPVSIQPLNLSFSEAKKMLKLIKKDDYDDYIENKLDETIEGTKAYKERLLFLEYYLYEFNLEENDLEELYWEVIREMDGQYPLEKYSKPNASSFLKPQGKFNYSPKNLYDFNYLNAWAEGVPGYGIGEYISFNQNISKDWYQQPFNSIIISNGYIKSKEAWKNNSRVKKLKLYLNEIPYAILHLEDSRSEQTFKFSKFLAYVKSIKLEIMEVYEGDKYDDTFISEIYFDHTNIKWKSN